MACRTLVLIRHGETTGGSSTRLFGATDVELSEAGRRQALRVREALATQTFDRVVASPLQRARLFAALAFPHHAPALELARGFAEIDFGAWEGLTWAEVEARHPREFAAWKAAPVDFTFPGGDSRPAFRARVAAATARLVEDGPARVAAVAHKGVIKAVLWALNGPAPDAYRKYPVELGSIHRLERRAEGWSIVTRNQTEHLGPEHIPD